MHCPCIHNWLVNLTLLIVKMYTHTRIFHYPHVVLPILTVASSFVQVVRNFGRAIAAAINSGSPDVWPKQFFISTCRASTRGLQYFSGNLTQSSLTVSRLIVGSSHPIWAFASACKGLVVWDKWKLGYNVKPLLVPEIGWGNTLTVLETFKTYYINYDEIIKINSYLHWNLYVCADDSDGPLSFVFDYRQQSFHCQEQGVLPGIFRAQQLEGASIFNSFGYKCGSYTFVPKCITLAKCWMVHFFVCLIGCCFHGVNFSYLIE